MKMIRRRMIRVANRDVHLLVAGQGSPLLLVHGSPNSGASLRPLIESLSERFTVFAPDTPGNGESDALTEHQDEPEAYGEALAMLLDALAVPQVGAYGFHSGATFVAELARLYPNRVCALVCDGIPLWNDKESRQFDAEFLASYAPTRDGAHLARLWTRLIDQNWYFPFHLRDKARAINFDLNDTQRLHNRAMELLAAGDAYRGPYGAALRADGAQRLQALKVPTLLLSDPQDVLRGHLRRIPKRKNLQVDSTKSRALQRRRIEEWFAKHAGPVSRWNEKQGARRFVDVSHGQVFMRIGSDPRAIWIHDVGESSLAAPEGTTSFDLPGHGLTNIDCPSNLKDLSAIVGEILDALHLDPGAPSMLGAGLGYQLANMIAGRRVSLRSTPCKVPDVAPKWDGSHLLTAWHFCRFRHLYRRWDNRVPEQRLRRAMPTAEELQVRMIDVLRAGQQTIERLLPYSVELPRTSDRFKD